MVEQFRLRSFTELLHTKFRIHVEPSQTIEVELVEVTDHGKIPAWEQFSILFQGPREPLLPQHIYQMEHETMGSFDLFLVPIGRDEKGTTYEAVFNREVKD
jgi:hypothetical protein